MEPRTAAANAARIRQLAINGAHDPVKLRRAVRVVQAAIRLNLITLDTLIDATPDANPGS